MSSEHLFGEDAESQPVDYSVYTKPHSRSADLENSRTLQESLKLAIIGVENRLINFLHGLSGHERDSLLRCTINAGKAAALALAISGAVAGVISGVFGTATYEENSPKKPVATSE